MSLSPRFRKTCHRLWPKKKKKDVKYKNERVLKWKWNLLVTCPRKTECMGSCRQLNIGNKYRNHSRVQNKLCEIHYAFKCSLWYVRILIMYPPDCNKSKSIYLTLTSAASHLLLMVWLSWNVKVHKMKSQSKTKV